MVSGINKVAYWFCHWLADAAQMIVPIAVIMIIFAAFNIEQYRGQLECHFRPDPLLHLVLHHLHAPRGLLLQERVLRLRRTHRRQAVPVRHLHRHRHGVGALKDVNDDTKKAYNALSVILPILIPHYSYGKGLYDIGQNKLNENRQRFDAQTMTLAPVGSKDWWADDVIGDDIAWLVGLAVGFGVLIILVELSEGSIATLASKGLGF